ncbi:MAG: hypothetical protein GF317_02515 [Candidatus Lokiarchaeota archaeon]|nr:hypothetical protein [Candidatus Lokiarchaeota archaeon]MBD3198780.1 hypothetical protein [Candidatus Lokiarchaeota archaeon]
MIRDVLVIKDGLPLYSKNFCNSKNFISDKNNLIMVSGFLSALNSFSEEFEDLGSIKELKLSNTDLRLAFLKNNTIPNLIFLASFDEKTNTVNVQRFLKKMSYAFLKKYNINRINNWTGQTNEFDSFEDVVSLYFKEENEENNLIFKHKMVDLFEEIKDAIDVEEKHQIISVNKRSKINDNANESPNFLKKIPVLKIAEGLNPKHYLTGNLALEIIKKIDSRKTVQKIAQELNVSGVKVHNSCKNLIKLGFIVLKNSH